MYDEFLQFIHSSIYSCCFIRTFPKMPYGLLTDMLKDVFQLLSILFCKGETQLQVKENCLKCCPVLTEVLQGFFSSSKGAPDIEYKRENNGDTQQGQIHIVAKIKMDRQVGNQNRYE